MISHSLCRNAPRHGCTWLNDITHAWQGFNFQDQINDELLTPLYGFLSCIARTGERERDGDDKYEGWGIWRPNDRGVAT